MPSFTHSGGPPFPIIQQSVNCTPEQRAFVALQHLPESHQSALIRDVQFARAPLENHASPYLFAY